MRKKFKWYWSLVGNGRYQLIKTLAVTLIWITTTGIYDLKSYPQSHDLDRMVRGYGAESKIPRVGSHGKLSRLQDQHDDGPQDLLTHEPRPRFVLQEHALPVRQHPLDASQECRRQEYAISDGSFHILSHQQPSAQPMVYHKEPVYRTGGGQFPQHHRHQIPDDGATYPTHEYIQQHHLQLPEDYDPAHIYQRSSSHVDGGGLHQQPLTSAHRAYAGNPVEHQYARRPHEESTRQQYRLSSCLPRYRDHHHHIEEQRPFIPLHQDLYSADHLAAATIIPPMPGMPLYGPGFQENSAYPENIQRSGRQTQFVEFKA
ncbi:hypothetical protein SELMODRAFT_430492 [Selaginella moellendorffii]|uniref:Uncharacterized protein n=1 Tax=Selaginella moellendorffii TaxID=88036 RepID=D8T9K9_SELML|nr:hypothetical protein SELMODRAFT_430492 [Selaginella moellendorffii]